MTYNPDIPQPNDDMSLSQGDLLTNFTDLNNVYGVNGDHVAFDAAADRGKHNKTTFPSLGAAPVDGSNLTPAEEAYIPNTEENDMALFSLEDNNETELFYRKESNGTVNQMTKDNELFIRAHPVFALNWRDPSPNSNTGAGTYNFTVSNSFNFDSANSRRLTSGRARYEFRFTDPVLDSAGNPTNNYLWTISGFDSSSNPVVGFVDETSTYGTSVGNNFIRVVFKNQNGTRLSQLTAGSIVCWRFQ